MADKSNDRSHVIASWFPPPAQTSHVLATSANIGPAGDERGRYSAAPVAMSPSESGIAILGTISNSLEHIGEILRDTFHQDGEIAAASAKARAEAITDANEDASRVRPVEEKDEDDSPQPVFAKGKLKDKAKGGLGAILKGLGGALGFLIPVVLGVGTVLAGFALPVLGIIAALAIGYEVFKNVKWEDMIEPFKNAFALLKDVALSVWDILGKVVDVIEVALMPMLRFVGDALNDYLIQPLITWLVPIWENHISPLVTSFGEGLVTVKNFFKGIQDLRGADLREAIVGGFMKMIDSLWDSIARSKFGKLLGMDTNEEKRAQEFEKKRETAREQAENREGVDNPFERWDTGINAMPEEGQAAARRSSKKLLERELARIDDEEAAASAPDATDEAIARGEAMADSPGLVRQSMSAVESVVPKLLQSSDAYAGLTIKPNAGKTSSRESTGGGSVEPGVIDLAHRIQASVTPFQRFTGFNDEYHSERGGRHPQGLALDFTLAGGGKDGPKAVATIKRIASDAGVNVDVIDEYAKASANATGGHIHAEFNSAKEAAAFSAAMGTDPSPSYQLPAPAPHIYAAEEQPDSPMAVGAPRSAGGIANPNAAAQSITAPGASRNAPQVAAGTAQVATAGAAATTIVANIGGPSAPAAPSTTTYMPFPVPIRPRTQDQVLLAMQSVNQA